MHREFLLDTLQRFFSVLPGFFPQLVSKGLAQRFEKLHIGPLLVHDVASAVLLAEPRVSLNQSTLLGRRF